MQGDSDGRQLGRTLAILSLVIVVVLNLGAYDLVAAPDAFRQAFGGVPPAIRILSFLACVVLGPTILILWILWDRARDVRRRALDQAFWILFLGGFCFFAILVFFE
ncbi:MAG: hypothetical protein K1X67_19970 [Fimbriimonadaceae bacterium]|nr:hypothetical protein [Fimbriimonadaceae bacterium]